ncbi:Cytochrome c, mono- and diheme variants [Hymenobacter gelipurpurascens]|uniref:Cytochrome c, mono- and diheme variants n=1 Tax=Hymenobacter gelipurpurascens TaxID=89968 RepID=A0A212T719_9BACT|nr:cytochrome c [Hymenobacter gelipurpurascens]SNC61584.1 Cytochrome c, mono- and diheme variants [Hymenobacter gelipurpurascens]
MKHKSLTLTGYGAITAAAFGTLLLSLSGCFTERRNEGAQLYATHCSSCHGDQGQGLKRLIPPVAAADYVAQHRAELPCLIRKGLKGPLVVNGIDYNQVMPGHEDLTDSQIANLLNFVQQSWGNKNQPYTIREASELLGHCNGSDGQ